MSEVIPAVLPATVLSAGEQPSLAAGELRLRPWQVQDAPAVLAAFSDPAIQHWHMRRFTTEAEARQWIDRWPPRWRANTDASWAITDATDSCIGYVAMRDLVPFAGTAQLSYWVLPTARGHRVATRAVRRVAEWALREVGLHRLYLTHSIRNPPSCRVADAVGFTLEGTLRQYLRHADGWHDVHMHGLLLDDLG